VSVSTRIERFLPVVIDNLTPIGGWNPRLLIRRIRQLLLVANCEIGPSARRPDSGHTVAGLTCLPA
jgi:hypothetical protein